MAQNKEVSAQELFEFLESISSYIERDIRMYALGGTALSILGIKKSTRDIDFNLESDKERNEICKVFRNLGFETRGIRWISQEGLAFDIFHGSNILGIELLPDCLEKSRFIRSFGKINLYTLPLEDIIISKLARGDGRDFDDIRDIFRESKIDIPALAERYLKTMENSAVANAKQKFLDLIDLKFREWRFKRDNKLIAEVKTWGLQ